MLSIPKLKDLVNTIRTAISANMGVPEPPASNDKSFINVTSAVDAAQLYTLYLTAQKVQQNCLPDLAETQASGGTLERFGMLKLNRLPYEATNGEYTIAVTCSGAGVGIARIKTGQTFIANDASKSPQKLYIYESADAIFGATTMSIVVRALEPGATSALNVSDVIELTSPVEYVAYQATVSAEVVGPVNAETIEEYRAKIIQSYYLDAQGGSAGDYRLWSYDAVGVKQSYPYSRDGDSAEVNIYVEASTGDGSASGTLIDDVEIVLATDPDVSLQDYERDRRPIGVQNVHVMSVTPVDIDITIFGYVGLTSDKQTLIEDSITSYVTAIRPHVDAIDREDLRNDTISLDGIRVAIAKAVVASVYSGVQLSVDGTVITGYYVFDQLSNILNIPKTPTITFS